MGAMDGQMPEREFACAVEALHGQPDGHARLMALLREDHAVYAQRSSAATARMRGWVLLALSRPCLPDEATIFAVEELDNGRTPYLVAAAARALRGALPTPAIAPFVVQALVNVRDRDEYLSLDAYGGTPTEEHTATTAFAELVQALHWLGPHAAGVADDLQALCTSRDRPLSPDQAEGLQAAVNAIRAHPAAPHADDCCSVPAAWGAFRRWAQPASPGALEGIEFEDHDGRRIGYREFFRGGPAVVVFFYTRCDNANKCSLSVTRLAHVQQLLAQAGMDARVRTAAITYDAAYDIPSRLRHYAQSRGVRMDDAHRVMRVVAGAPALSAHFRPGVNFVESLVNRHRIEVFVLDESGQVAASFERLRWDARQVADEAMRWIGQPARAAQPTRRPHAASPLLAMALAVFPKCPVCGATYLSVSGIAALPHLPPLYWFFPVLLLAMAINLFSLWRLARHRGQWLGFGLALGGAALVLTFGVATEQHALMVVGIAMTIIGSLLGVSLRSSARMA